MTKIKIKYICQKCSFQTTNWMGKCPECEEWNSFIEEESSQKLTKRSSEKQAVPKLIEEIEDNIFIRVESTISEFDRVVGGGLVQGSLLLIGGEPGIGKSTLLMDVCGKLSCLLPDEKILYVSGEESESQVAERSKRLNINEANFYIYNETSWQKILTQIKKLKPRYLVIDSIQTTVSEEINSAPGTISQIREITYELMNYTKANNITSFIVGHITKEGTIAGPKVLEHMVDTVIYFEGDQTGQYRLLRVMKNRFGNTNEVGIFEMRDEGLNEVPNPSEYFLDPPGVDAYGRSITSILEGTRPLLVEIQALVVENKFGNGRRTTQGLDSNRLAMLVAIIEKYFGQPIGFNDIYVNVVGGIKLASRESDLSIIASLLSSLCSCPIDDLTVFIGEVGLTGEVRSVSRMEIRLKELAQLNYKRVITSKRVATEFVGKFDIEIIGIAGANEIEKILFN